MPIARGIGKQNVDAHDGGDGAEVGISEPDVHTSTWLNCKNNGEGGGRG